MTRARITAYLLLTVTSLFWAGNMVMSRGLRADLPPIALAFWRWMIAFACVLPLALPHLRAQWPALRAAWKRVIFLGVFGVGFYNTFSYIAVQYTTATSATLLNSFIPVATIALAFVFLGKRLGRMEAVGVLVSLAGVIVLIGRGSMDTLLGLQLNTGDVWMLAAVLAWSIYTVGLQWRPQGVHPMLLLASFIVVGLAVMAPMYAWEVASGATINLHAGSVAGILYAGIVAAFLGFVCFNAGVSEVGPSIGSLFIHLQPVFASILSALLLGESPQWYHYLGMALVFSGIVATMWRSPAVRPATAARGSA
ncbi:DMT family transporter [Thauera sinica]|uniref:DMT family transporter n=1 Tax=Thauera sinica TaxID=2665146 RepID=A0ABW1AVK4_9RHOO|nr:DMT family transporter [Thauera sp. K11]ATE60131.1 EamA family transporter [Thauera sp. K11]